MLAGENISEKRLQHSFPALLATSGMLSAWNVPTSNSKHLDLKHWELWRTSSTLLTNVTNEQSPWPCDMPLRLVFLITPLNGQAMDINFVFVYQDPNALTKKRNDVRSADCNDEPKYPNHFTKTIFASCFLDGVQTNTQACKQPGIKYEKDLPLLWQSAISRCFINGLRQIFPRYNKDRRWAVRSPQISLVLTTIDVFETFRTRKPANFLCRMEHILFYFGESSTKILICRIHLEQCQISPSSALNNMLSMSRLWGRVTTHGSFLRITK